MISCFISTFADPLDNQEPLEEDVRECFLDYRIICVLIMSNLLLVHQTRKYLRLALPLGSAVFGSLLPLQKHR
jgi:hypothetical protein